MAAWQTATLKDANAVTVNPLFTNAATGNLKPTAITLNDKGTFVSITTDITGAARSTTTPDMGAYEFSEALPIKLVDISATKMSADVLVNWSTATEINTNNFVIERSLDGIAFTAAGTIAAHGNSTTLQQYRFNDKYAATSFGVKTLYYRIKSVDKDGYTEYTRIVAVHLNNKAGISVSSFPNPFVSSLYVKIAAVLNENVTIQILDITGKIVFIQQYKVVVGTNLIQLADATKLSKGTYMIQVQMNSEQYLIKVVK